MGMASAKARTTVSIDADLLSEAGQVLGTARASETVNAAMADVVRRERLRRLAENDFPDLTLASIHEMRRARHGES